MTPVLWVLGLLSAANGMAMLAVPARWYRAVLAPVPGLDLLTEHFVRDVGCAFLTVGAALIWAAAAPALRRPLVAIGALFLLLHAGLHVFDTARGYLGPAHWFEDLPGVYLPALLAAVLAARSWRREPR